MKKWFSSLNGREQVIVGLLSLVIVGGGAYLFVVEPLSRGITDRRVSVQAQESDLAWMQQQAGLIKATGSRGNSPIRKMEKAPYLLLDDALRRAQLKSPERLEPAGNEGAKAQFSEVEFDKLLGVLGELEQSYGLSVKTLSVTRKNDGLVSARLSLEITP